MDINMSDQGAQTCSLSLLVKDHKGWNEEHNCPPPSRPVIAGNSGLNMHLSELISKILEPIAEEAGGFEVKSTGDMMEKIQSLNNVPLEDRERTPEQYILPPEPVGLRGIRPKAEASTTWPKGARSDTFCQWGEQHHTRHPASRGLKQAELHY